MTVTREEICRVWHDAVKEHNLTPGSDIEQVIGKLLAINDTKIHQTGYALLLSAIEAVRVFDDWTNHNETQFTGWGEGDVPPAAEFWRVKSGQALKALENVKFHKDKVLRS